MKLKPLALSDPIKEDALNRKENVEILTQLVSTYRESMVLCIDSPWGTGKTTFIKIWEQYLKENSYPSLYFNAWENDFSDDALVSLIGEMETGFQNFNLKGKEKTKAKRAFNKTKKIGAKIIKKTLPLALKAVTAGIVDIKAIGEDYEKALAELSQQIAEEKIKEYEEKKKTIQEFKKKLAEFAKTISEPKDGEKPMPIIFFIDELDRCRPTYAIELLEKAKHLFNVDGIVFVLAIDKTQLGHSIRAVYGQDLDVDGYIRRFIDLTYQLPKASNEKFCHFLSERFGLPDFLARLYKNRAESTQYDFMDVLPELFTLFNFSLRMQEQYFSQLSVVLRAIESPGMFAPKPMAYLIFLKIAAPEIYKKYVIREASVEEITSFIKKLNGGEGFLADYYGTEFEAILISLHSDSAGFRRDIGKYNEILSKNEESEEGVNNEETIRARKIKGLIDHNYFSYRTLDEISKRIDITEHFSDL